MIQPERMIGFVGAAATGADAMIGAGAAICAGAGAGAAAGASVICAGSAAMVGIAGFTLPARTATVFTRVGVIGSEEPGIGGETFVATTPLDSSIGSPTFAAGAAAIGAGAAAGSATVTSGPAAASCTG